MELIINVEAQARNSPGYALTKRALYYCARLISAQKNVDFVNSEYQNLKKVYSIWVVSRPPRRARNTITEYSIREQCRAGATRVSREEYDMLKVVFLYLGSYEDEKAIPTLRLLDMLHSDGLTDAEKKRRMREEFGIAITESIDKEVTEMCNWSQGIKEEYLTKGRREGRKEGIDIGEKRGRRLERQRSMQQIQLERQRSMQQVQLERQRTAKNLLSLGMSFEQAVEALGLKSPEDIEYLRTHV